MFYGIEHFQTNLHSIILRSLLDTILDRTVVAGYTRIGYRMRRGTWSPAELQAMGGKVVLVTGATSGLGAAPVPAHSSGGFWHDRRERPAHRVPQTKQTRQDRERLWAECERLSGWRQTPARRPARSEASR